jgi:hypothetical protein
MEKQLRVDPKSHTLLSTEEMRTISGGSLTETLVKLAISAAAYFFNMGVQEAKRMKALL